MKYANGLKIAMFPNKNALTVSLNIFVRAGAIYETSSQAGISHFLEHLMFKGSAKYPGDALSRNTENMGGYINAATSKQYTVYYVNIQKDGTEETLKMLIDAVASPLIPQEEFIMEKRVIIEEIQRHYDNPMNVLFDEFFEEMFVESDMRKNILGTKKTIESLKRGDIFDYYGDFYALDNMVVALGEILTRKNPSKLF